MTVVVRVGVTSTTITPQHLTAVRLDRGIGFSNRDIDCRGVLLQLLLHWKKIMIMMLMLSIRQLLFQKRIHGILSIMMISRHHRSSGALLLNFCRSWLFLLLILLLSLCEV